MKTAKKILLHPLLLMTLSVLLITSALAQPSGPVAPAAPEAATVEPAAPADVPAADAPAPTVPALPSDAKPETKPETKPAPAGDMTLDAALAELKKLRADYAEYKSAEAGARRGALFGLIAAIFMLLVRITREPLVSRFGSGVITKIGLAAGVGVGLFAALAAGQPVLDSILYGAGPPLSTFLHELLKSRSKPAVV